MRFAVFGAGGWAGRRHIDALKVLGHEIVALVDPGPATAEQARAVGAKAVGSIDELDLASIEAATLALPPALHPEMTERLARAGKHVLCEKPMALDSHGARRVADFARGAGVVIMPGYMLRCHPLLRAFRERLAALGRLRRISITTNTFKTGIDGWRAEPGSGGVMLSNGIHQLDLANWFAGARFRATRAQLENIHFEMQTEDFIQASLAEPSGCIGLVQSSWSPFPPHSSDGMMTTPSGRMRIEAEAEGGAMVLTATGFRIGNEEVVVEGAMGVDPFVEEIGHFVDAIRNDTPLWQTPEDNFNVQHLIEECRSVAASPMRAAAA